MKLRWPALALVLVLIAALFLPAVTLHVHSRVDGAIAAQIPESISLGKLILSGSGAIHPTLTSLERMQTARLELGLGLALAAAGGCLLLFPRRKITCAALWCSGLSLALLGAGVFHWTNLDNSLLFEMMISLGIGLYLPVIAAAVTLLWSALSLRIREPETQKPLCADDRKLRLISAGLAIAALILFFLPAYRVSLPDTVTGTPGDAAILNRDISLFDIMLGQEKNLYALGQEREGLKTPISGDLAELNAFSNDQNNVGGVFQIRSANTGSNPLLMAVAALLLLSAVLGLIPKVDRWFSVVMISGAAVLLATEIPGLLTIGAGDMYASASRQLLLLGIGKVTFLPLLAVAFAAASAVTGILGIRYANEPYFVNPLPAGFRIRFVAICLSVIALVCMLLPGATVSFSKPGKNKVLATATISGTDALTLKAADRLINPTDSKGKPVYSEEDPAATPAMVQAGTDAMASRFTWLTWAALILTLAGTILLIAKANKRLVMAMLLCATVVRLVTWLALGAGLDRNVAVAEGSLYLYASLPLLIFAAFFSNFAALEELPKKYKLFLMMLPFLLAVFLFSYLPLYGWSYAFYNYKFGLPMDQQEFVGLKWFSEMFTNPANRENIFRVLKNTLGMSGLNLATSWLPMIFAVFLNEITRTRFKKFVQIFTTLPNFISWALVFSFAMCLFAADTGIYSKLMMELGLNDPNNPTVWLNSGDQIWLKMWGWSTWKGLGWGAIMYLAAIAGIDQELYEAARVDGANRWALMRHITLPSLLPTFFVLLMLSISNILNNGMEQYLVFQNPMNRQTIEVLDLYVYNITIASRGTTLYAYATAIGILKTLVSVTLLFSANFLSKKLRGESIM